MVLPVKSTHPVGESLVIPRNPLTQTIEVEIYAEKAHLEWNQAAAVIPLGQLSFFYLLSENGLLDSLAHFHLDRVLKSLGSE